VVNVDGCVSSGGMGGPAILPLSLANMAKMTRAFPDRAFSGIGGISTFEHALSYLRLGCGTTQVATAAMLDHAIGPKVIRPGGPPPPAPSCLTSTDSGPKRPPPCLLSTKRPRNRSRTPHARS
jgi:hypothetical protein